MTTPVWFAESLGTMYVETHADAGKLKRLRHNTHVAFAPCTYSGKASGSVIEGNARILTESQESMEASTALAKKYGFMRNLFHFVRNAQRMLQRKAKVGEVYIVIQPISSCI